MQWSSTAKKLEKKLFTKKKKNVDYTHVWNYKFHFWVTISRLIILQNTLVCMNFEA